MGSQYDALSFLGIGLSAGVFGFGFILALVIYLIAAFLLFKIGENRNDDLRWMAFVPILNTFYVPYLIKDQANPVFKGKFLIVYIACLVLSVIPILGIIFSIASLFLSFYAYFLLFRDYSDNYVMHIVLLVITFGISYYVSLFRFRNRTPRYISG